ncbi:AAA family ATPase [Glycomyces sp. L485]|uniref:AAA family ATPase n=1 Tax=Glycomyces sp. L485 TaxID=2909235 RepID=UPI001F4A8086|nr:AAA family ATPase [Glycomyces sp. L485]MCH7230204.1 AAA family ATPase [Glycomyces sp. L485]
MFDSATDPGPGSDAEDVFDPEPRQIAWTADQLMATVFPEPKWAVPGMLCEGLSLLCGPPKVGKSWASLALALAIASGGRAFGKIPVDAGAVLYLALEDTARRLQARMRTILAGQDAPEGLTLLTECPRLDRGGDEWIEAWIRKHPDARLIVVDVFAKVRPAPTPGVGAYDGDYAAVGVLKRLADKHGIAIVAVHHIRKAGSEDFLTEVSGTNGIAGAADATLVLKRGRGQADGILNITGRDVEETEHAMGFNPATGAWTLLEGDPRQLTATDNQSVVHAWLREHPDSGPSAIAAGTGLSPDSVKTTLRRGAQDGWFVQARRGQWAVADDGDEAEELW